MANSVRVKISNAQDYTPHAELLADSVALDVLIEATSDLDPSRASVTPTRLGQLVRDLRRAKEALQIVSKK